MNLKLKSQNAERDGTPRGKIEIRGARTHNLKSVNLDIPRGQFVVITGVSGSGKSSFAFDTLFAEGQRQFLESLSTYARQFVDQMERPDVDSIRGLQPSLCIDQQQGTLSPRSTVGTTTEIYDFLRLLMARAATPACANCGTLIQRQSPEDIANEISKLPIGTKLTILAPLVIGRKGAHVDVFDRISKAGLVRVKVDGELYELEDYPKLAIRKEHSISAVVDRIILREDSQHRILHAIESTLRLSSGLVETAWVDVHSDLTQEKIYSTKFACLNCGTQLIEIEPRNFSFNSPYGACATCDGFGRIDDGKTLCPTCRGARLKMESLAIKLADRSVFELVQSPLDQLYNWFRELSFPDRIAPIGTPIVKEILTRMKFLCDVGLNYLTLDRNANSLSGGELQRVRLATSIGTGLTGVCYVLDEPSVGLHPRDTKQLIASLKQLQQKGNTVVVVEHDHELMLAADRIIDFGPGAGVEGGTIVANDTPIALIKKDAIKRYPHSTTVRHLSSQKLPPSSRNRAIQGEVQWIQLKGIKLNNLQGIDVRIPRGRLVGISGVSGSGKSTLIYDTLAPAIASVIQSNANGFPLHLKSIEGVEDLDKIISIDQTPIGRSPRSTAATYCGFWDDIRKVFAATRDAKQRGYTAAHFSFNSGNGRCEVCSGQGRQKIEMNFLPDVYVTCSKCRGTRFQRSVRAVRFKEKSIAQVLEMSISEAAEFFSEIPRLKQPLDCLVRVGLGYLPIGQPATTLSGGEAQRIKLASELSRPRTEGTIYLLDEPTSGLHAEDVHRLIEILQELVDKGSSVLIIEHHVDVLNVCDWLIDMGPGAGAEGGRVIAEGIPSEVAKLDSYTAAALRK